ANPRSDASSGSDNSTIRLWRLEAGSAPSLPIAMRGHTGGILALAFSGDGKKLYSSSLDNTIRQWTVSVNDLLRQARVTAGRNFTSDERRLFGIAGPLDSASAGVSRQNAGDDQLPMLNGDPSIQYGFAKQRFELKWNTLRTTLSGK